MGNIREEYNFSMNPIVAGQVAKGSKKHLTWSAYLGGTLILVGVLFLIWVFLPIKGFPVKEQSYIGIIGVVSIIVGIFFLSRFPTHWRTPDESWEEMHLSEHEDVDDNP